MPAAGVTVEDTKFRLTGQSEVFQVRVKVDPYILSDSKIAENLTLSGGEIRDASAYYQNVTSVSASGKKYDFTAAQVIYATTNVLFLGVTDGKFPKLNSNQTATENGYFWDLRISDYSVDNTTTPPTYPNLSVLSRPNGAAFGTGGASLCKPSSGTSTCLPGKYFTNLTFTDSNALRTTIKANTDQFVVYDFTAKTDTGTAFDKTDAGANVAGNRYFAIGGTQIQGGANVSGLPGVTAGNVSVTKYVVTNGLSNYNTGSTLETQAAALTLTGASSITNTAFRPEATFIPSVARGDTQLLVTSSGAAGFNPFLRADVQLDNTSGRSSISVATGNVAPLGGDGSLALSGNMVGSYRPASDSFSTAIASPLGSIGTDNTKTAAHLFGTNATTGTRIGYFGVSQVDPAGNIPTYDPKPATLQKGNEAAVNYAYSRLAVGISANNGASAVSDFDTSKRLTTSQTITGYAAALVETTGGSIYGLTSSTETSNTPSNASIALDPSKNNVSATLKLNRDTNNAAVELNYGGDTAGRSAYVSNSVFGAINPASGKAGGLVSVGDDLKAGVANPVGQSGVGAINSGKSLCECAYAQWGFFFGDVSKDSSSRERINLGSWVAGKPTDPTTIPSTGTATYYGHMIGTAANAAGLRDQVGSFKNAWDFGAKTGAITASFDGANYSGALKGGSTAAQFGGTVNNTGAATRAMSMQGSFFGPASSSSAPPEMGGQFSIKETSGSAAYRAQGTFLGKR